MVHTNKTTKELAEGFAKRLNEALSANGITRHGAGELLHKETGMTVKQCNNWLNGEKFPRKPSISKIATLTGYREAWLEYGELPKRPGDPMPVMKIEQEVLDSSLAKSGGKYQNVELVHTNRSVNYPVISWVRAGQWDESTDMFESGYAEEWESSDSAVGQSAFWLKVVGDSMTSPVGLSIPEGHMILVDPEAIPENGSLVIAKIHDSNEVTFKKLVHDGGTKYLKPLNNQYQTNQINGNCEIVGVVKEAKIKL